MSLSNATEPVADSETQPLLAPVEVASQNNTQLQHNTRSGITYWSNLVFNITVWVSAVLFGLYILAFYVLALPENDMRRWNNVLRDLYIKDFDAANVAIGLHFLGGAVILVLGSVQFISFIRTHYPRIHRWTGRIYIVACVLTSVGGLGFIIIRRTVGGIVMDIGFALYGILMFICAIQTIRYARLRLIPTHREWAMRLYSLAIGSWLYRIVYGFWIIFTNGLGHTDDFRGWFDHIMAFAFYIPNLVVVEIMIQRQHKRNSTPTQTLATVLFLVSTGFLMIGTYFFTRYIWGPAIINYLTPSSVEPYVVHLPPHAQRDGPKGGSY